MARCDPGRDFVECHIDPLFYSCILFGPLGPRLSPSTGPRHDRADEQDDDGPTSPWSTSLEETKSPRTVALSNRSLSRSEGRWVGRRCPVKKGLFFPSRSDVRRHPSRGGRRGVGGVLHAHRFGVLEPSMSLPPTGRDQDVLHRHVGARGRSGGIPGSVPPLPLVLHLSHTSLGVSRFRSGGPEPRQGR